MKTVKNTVEQVKNKINVLDFDFRRRLAEDNGLSVDRARKLFTVLPEGRQAKRALSSVELMHHSIMENPEALTKQVSNTMEATVKRRLQSFMHTRLVREHQRMLYERLDGKTMLQTGTPSQGSLPLPSPSNDRKLLPSASKLIAINSLDVDLTVKQEAVLTIEANGFRSFNMDVLEYAGVDKASGFEVEKMIPIPYTPFALQLAAEFGVKMPLNVVVEGEASLEVKLGVEMTHKMGEKFSSPKLTRNVNGKGTARISASIEVDVHTAKVITAICVQAPSGDESPACGGLVVEAKMAAAAGADAAMCSSTTNDGCNDKKLEPWLTPYAAYSDNRCGNPRLGPLPCLAFTSPTPFTLKAGFWTYITQPYLVANVFYSGAGLQAAADCAGAPTRILIYQMKPLAQDDTAYCEQHGCMAHPYGNMLYRHSDWFHMDTGMLSGMALARFNMVGNGGKLSQSGAKEQGSPKNSEALNVAKYD